MVLRSLNWIAAHPLHIALALLPVTTFLIALIYLDSYKLIKFRQVLRTIGVGCLVAAGCWSAAKWLILGQGVDPETLRRLVGPVVEEVGKALFLVYLIRTHRVGFLVDAAIHGFAVGAGFALVENIYYLTVLPDASLAACFVRGTGTAMMHGGTTAIFGISAKALTDRAGLPALVSYLPGLAGAVAIHAAFNRFLISPVLSALGVLIALPPLIFFVFSRSERALEQWLSVGFDSDARLLELIHSGELSESRVGRYLTSLKERFDGIVLVDMLCYLRLHVELSMRAKGLLMMAESGFQVSLDAETRAKIDELGYLEKSIGKTGKLAMAPFLHGSAKDLWQLHMLAR